MFCYRCGQEIPDDSVFCFSCGTRITDLEVDDDVMDAEDCEPSESLPFEAYGEEPPVLREWNWGSFLLTPLWALVYRHVGLGVLMIAVNVFGTLIHPYLPLVNWGFAIYLGIKGYGIAWDSGRFDTAQEMVQAQRKWTGWGLGLQALVLVLYLVTSPVNAILVIAFLLIGLVLSLVVNARASDKAPLGVGVIVLVAVIAMVLGLGMHEAVNQAGWQTGIDDANSQAEPANNSETSPDPYDQTFDGQYDETYDGQYDETSDPGYDETLGTTGDEVTTEAVFLHDPQPATVSASDFGSTEFVILYDLSDGAGPASTMIVAYVADTQGNQQGVSLIRGQDVDWSQANGEIRFVLSSLEEVYAGKAEEDLVVKQSDIDHLVIQVIEYWEEGGDIQADLLNPLSNSLEIPYQQ
ncbi:MAG: zinc ribbon domain-containing protein [Candidatus Aquicultorales bacterium]